MKHVKAIGKQLLQRALGGLGYELVHRQPRPQWPEETSRYAYQKLFNDFNIAPGSVVLDIGSGAYPFPFATILTDRYLETTQHRSEKLILDRRPFLLSDIEHLPFADKAIDFVYCSHVLEHVDNPLQACAEIVRIGKRGYIETPTFAKDALFSWAKGMHKWHIVSIADKLIFFEYSERQLEGVRYNTWREAILGPHYHPLQDVYYNNPEIFNVMFPWNGGFDCVVYYLDGRVAHASLK